MINFREDQKNFSSKTNVSTFAVKRIFANIYIPFRGKRRFQRYVRRHLSTELRSPYVILFQYMIKITNIPTLIMNFVNIEHFECLFSDKQYCTETFPFFLIFFKSSTFLTLQKIFVWESNQAIPWNTGNFIEQKRNNGAIKPRNKDVHNLKDE